MQKKVELRTLTERERETLEKLIKSQTAPAIEVERAKTIWLLHNGEKVARISQKLDRTEVTIYQRLQRFNELGLDSLVDQARTGRPTTYTEEERGQMIAAARTHPQKAGRSYSHWTLSRLVEYVNQAIGIPISRAQLARVLEEEGLRWYQEQTYFTERPDPQFVEKRGAIVKLYQEPPANTQVVCVDELGPLSAKTYPAKRWSDVGHPPRVASDYGRRATVWTFGAFEPRTGDALTVCAERRQACDFTDFLEQVVRHWPQGEIILILDNLSVHRSLEVQLWALAHERVRFLFQPTYAPWLNLIEPWWKTLRSLALRGRCFEGAMDLIEAIEQGTKNWNDHCHAYHWRKSYSNNHL